MVTPAELSEMVMPCGHVYVAPGRLNVGVAAAVEKVNLALAKGLSKKPVLFAIAWIVVVTLTGMAVLYTGEEAVGVLPSVV
jgi:chemotaxis response regulator CheB